MLFAALAVIFLTASIVYEIEINADLHFHKYGGRNLPRLRRNRRLCWIAFAIFGLSAIVVTYAP